MPADFQIGDGGRHRAVAGVGRAEKIFKRLTKAECDAALRIVINLDLPKRDIVALERLPAVSRGRAVLVDTDLHWSDLRTSAWGR